MRYGLRLVALACVGAVLYFFIHGQVNSDSAASEQEAYRDWMIEKAEAEVQKWDEYYGIAGQQADRHYSIEPYSDPTLYTPGSTVLQPGETWTDEIQLALPGGSDRRGSSVLGEYPRDPRIRVLGNTWQDQGVQIEIDRIWVDSYVYSTWLVREDDREYPLTSLQPRHDAATLGSYTRDEIALLQNDGARFNVEKFNAGFDLSRGKGSGWRARVRYWIHLPADFPAHIDDRSIAAEISITSGAGGQPYKLYLVHLEGQEGVALRPMER